MLGDCFDAREESEELAFHRCPPRHTSSFFDNEYGNCREISSGVTVAFSPDGVTGDVWAEAVAAFPSAIVNDYWRVVGVHARSVCFLFPLHLARGQTAGDHPAAAARRRAPYSSFFFRFFCASTVHSPSVHSGCPSRCA